MSRGIWERTPGSGIWWIHYFDAEGKRHREKVGRKADAIKLYHQRKADAQAGRKLVKPLRQRERSFREFADNAIQYANKHKANPADDEQKIAILVEEFGDRLPRLWRSKSLKRFWNPATQVRPPSTGTEQL